MRRDLGVSKKGAKAQNATTTMRTTTHVGESFSVEAVADMHLR
jgi:hypothetical protein